MEIETSRLALFRCVVPLFWWALLPGEPAAAADFDVRTPTSMFIFEINGDRFPNLTLVRGQTYTFDVQTANLHPFHIESPGVDNNDINSGVITYSVPTNHANHYYECVVHGAQMRGEIFTIEPPRIEILGLSVGTNLVLASTMTNGWNVYAEYKTSLIGTNWLALDVQSNRLVNGTLETFCGRPPVDAAFVRIRSTR